MRRIDKIVVHCTATRAGREVGIDELRRWHKERGWQDVGYHYVVHLSGEVSKGRPDEVAGAHVRGHNANSIGVVYVGGIDFNGRPYDTRTPQQKATLVQLLKELKKKYPNATICGHRDLSPDKNRDGRITPDEWLKACPCFDATSEYKDI